MDDDALDRLWHQRGLPQNHFDRQGRPISISEWCRLWEDKDYQVLVQTWTRSGAFVSTVWLGQNHNFFSSGRIIIFESMVFHDGEDLEQTRYSTEAEALAGHQSLVRQFGGLDPDQTDRPDRAKTFKRRAERP